MAFINKLSTLSFKKLFLIDAIGALVSAFMLGFILTNFEPYFGMPKNILYILAIFPIIFCPYSFICSFSLNKNWRPYLIGIAIANLLYSIVSLFFIGKFYSELTSIGLGYFIVEIVIIVSLARAELKKASNFSTEI